MKKIIYASIAFVLFLFVYFISTTGFGASIDQIGKGWAHSIDKSFLEDVLEVISDSGSILLVGCTGILSIWFFYKKDWKMLFFYYVANIGGIVFNYILKFAIHRPRPEDIEHSFHIGSLKIISYSFPSGHTMRATILMLTLIFLAYYFLKNIQLRKGVVALCVFYLLAMGMSRILLLDHFITDVLAAIFASITWMYLSVYILEYGAKKIPFIRHS